MSAGAPVTTAGEKKCPRPAGAEPPQRAELRLGMAGQPRGRLEEALLEEPEPVADLVDHRVKLSVRESGRRLQREGLGGERSVERVLVGPGGPAVPRPPVMALTRTARAARTRRRTAAGPRCS